MPIIGFPPFGPLISPLFVSSTTLIMAGLGRRSHYRKHLTDAVLHDLPEPDESLGQRIARVVGTRGGNMFDVVVAPTSSTSAAANDAESKAAAESEKSNDIKPQNDKPDNIIQDISIRTPQLAFLPTKFRKLVWIKRNDFVIVQCGDEAETTTTEEQTKEGGGAGFRYVISHILYKDQVKHIKSKGLWPSDSFFEDVSNFDEKQQSSSSIRARPQDEESDDEYEEYQDDGGIVFDDPLDDEFMVNTNRIAAMRVEDSSSDESDD